DVSMEEETYRRKGIASLIEIAGDIEGRIILDTDPVTAIHIAKHLAGGEVESSDELVRETICELANMVIGNAVTSLNDQGFRFKISPPEVHTAEQGLSGSEETEALVMCFETAKGSVYMNIAMRYNRRRKEERSASVVA
ncbi:MAG TPA: chemotaxis protein CheX, partial [Terriglobales bacterium]|nr:chemotaxis protein CheX [Terriglobales bacterium]